MEDTGRILRGLSPIARKIIFGENADKSIDEELIYSIQVDKAHLIMLLENNIIEKDDAKKILKEIEDLNACDFKPLRGKEASRGLYLLYEDYLIEKLGDKIGGILQTARSRNDLDATILKLKLREPYLKLLRELFKLQEIILEKSDEFKNIVMPAYTHYQAALPITYGHYLSGIATELDRDIKNILIILEDLNYCPLGSGAVGGTSFPINPNRTALLLGFDKPVINSLDGVASRDFILRLMANATILGMTISRLCSDLLLWTTSEFGFISLPDELVGSSSMMPNKRNPFLLEQIQGKSTSVLGAFTAAVTAMHAKPFTNSIPVKNEAVKHVWKSFQDISETIILMQLIIENAKPEKEEMLKRAIEGHTSATELANKLVREGKISFRTAHKRVGEIVRLSIENKKSFEEVASELLKEENISLEGLDPESIVKKSIYGGGPGNINGCLKELEENLINYKKQIQNQSRKWIEADEELNRAVKSQ